MRRDRAFSPKQVGSAAPRQTDIILTREDADQIQTTLGKAHDAISKINPTLAYQLLHCIKALDPEPAAAPEKGTEPVQEPKSMAETIAAGDVSEEATANVAEDETETKSD